MWVIMGRGGLVRVRALIELWLLVQAGKAALVAEESAVSAANLARAARALGAAMLAAQAYNQVSLVRRQALMMQVRLYVVHSEQIKAPDVEPVMCLWMHHQAG